MDKKRPNPRGCPAPSFREVLLRRRLAADLVEYQPARAHDVADCVIIWTGMRMVHAWSAIALSRSARRRLRGRGLDGGQDEEETDQDSGWRASSAMSPPTFTNLVPASGLYVGRAFPEV